MPHPLAPLLAPESVALVGASVRPDTPGHDMLLTLRRSGFAGRVHLVNPNYETIGGERCHSRLADLPEAVDLAVLCVNNRLLERALQEAADAGARAAVIFASGHLDEDRDPPLTERLAQIARRAGMPVCGVNCMGFYNDEHPVWICGFPSGRTLDPGGTAYIAQSGSVFGALAHNDPRLRFNIAVSPGQELVTTVTDYLDYALDLDSTRVVGLFIEAVRDPAGFMRALDKAQRRAIPVVVLKVGRSAEAQALAVTHTGALTGNDAAFDALCRRYGVMRVDTIDELAATLTLFDCDRRAGPGGLATIHDSGGEREMVVDLAAQMGVPFGPISEATRTRLASLLDYGLEPHNPLDAWGTGKDFQRIFTECLQALHDDGSTALAALFADVRDGYYVSEGLAQACLDVSARGDKLVALAANYSGVRHDRMALRLTRAGVPVLDGTAQALAAIRHAFAFRDFQNRPRGPTPAPPPGLRAKWLDRLRQGPPLGEIEGLALLADYGIPTPARAVAHARGELSGIVAELGFPLALKTAEAGIAHKTEHGGVHLNLRSVEAVEDAYDDLARRLGGRVLAQRMAPAGFEMVMGMTVDPQFGPLVMVGAGGIFVEVLKDVAYALAPFGEAEAAGLLDGLKVWPILAGARGRTEYDTAALARVLSAFSVLCADLAEGLSEIDVNPIIVHEEGVTAVDALVVAARHAET